MATKTKTLYYVTKDGVDCGIASSVALGFAVELQSGALVAGKACLKSGFLIKLPDRPHAFPGEKSALAAIRRTEKRANMFRGTMADTLPRLQPLVERGTFAVRKAYA